MSRALLARCVACRSLVWCMRAEVVVMAGILRCVTYFRNQNVMCLLGICDGVSFICDQSQFIHGYSAYGPGSKVDVNAHSAAGTRAFQPFDSHHWHLARN